MFGIEMMLKNMGLDPETIKASVQNLANLAIDLKEQMDRIESKLDAVLSEKSSAEKLDMSPASFVPNDAETSNLKIVSE